MKIIAFTQVTFVIALSLENTYRRMNNLPGTVAFNELPGLSEKVAFNRQGVFLNIRGLNYTGVDLQPEGNAVYREICDCLKDSQGDIKDYRFRCAKLYDKKGEVRVAYGTDEHETQTEQLCWRPEEHLGMLVCSCDSLNRLYI